MPHKAEHIWRYRDLDVMYEPAVDGGGMTMAAPLIDFIQSRFGADRHFQTAFEWCSGAGFLGFALLAEGICESLCLADVNSKAIEYVNRTIEANRLQDRARAYVSDNMASIPRCEHFDLVVGNPPSFCNVNADHPLHSFLKDNTGASDPGWRTHANFYSQIASFLNLNAPVLVFEVNLFARDVFTPGCSVPLDVR